MPEQQTLGSWRGVSLDIAAWDGVAAEVDLSFACMFTRERDGGPRGGLAHLDHALSGMLLRARDEGVFQGTSMETLLISQPPASIAARAVMVIGMGEPSAWLPAVTAGAVATAVRAAMQLGVASAAFAPSLLDAGLAPGETAGAGPEMMKAVTRAIDAQASMATYGLVPTPSLRRWVFDVGAAGYAAAAEAFQATLAQLKAG
ncbi:M17 family peptidase N-terminal domain-containing protein [Dyella japonica]|uniref:M17 family peptidase N-terminal domain-containing protein n=1 Tax=Dyella japonica TaxID=231455 RepID=UPI000AAFEC5B|nr:M17 family peptidase N-terminal domain-containing protein [Dyella japonica]